MRTIVGRILTDRFWQSGISEGSKEDFYARVLDKKHTLEGLASTIRGSIRYVRESCYAIIYCMTRLDTQFYGFSELPEPLARAILAEASSLSAHQLINLLNLVRFLVDNCPVPLRDHFLPPILEACFRQMDARVNSEWARLGQQQVVESAGDDLTEEMKNESILRQLTYASVMLVADFLDPARKSEFTLFQWVDRTDPGRYRHPKGPTLGRGFGKVPFLEELLLNAYLYCRASARLLHSCHRHKGYAMLQYHAARSEKCGP